MEHVRYQKTPSSSSSLSVASRANVLPSSSKPSPSRADQATSGRVHQFLHKPPTGDTSSNQESSVKKKIKALEAIPQPISKEDTEDHINRGIRHLHNAWPSRVGSRPPSRGGSPAPTSRQSVSEAPNSVESTYPAAAAAANVASSRTDQETTRGVGPQLKSSSTGSSSAAARTNVLPSSSKASPSRADQATSGRVYQTLHRPLTGGTSSGSKSVVQERINAIEQKNQDISGKNTGSKPRYRHCR